MSESLKDLLAAEAAHAEATRDEPYPEGTVWTQPNKAKSVVQSVRLSAETFAEIERLAAEQESPVSAVIRGLVLKGLAAAPNEDLVVSAAELQRFISSQSHPAA